MQFKLTELYNTKYFYITFYKDLNYLFETFLKLQKDPTLPYNIGNDLLGKVYEAAKNGTPVEFDLAKCKITTDVLPLFKNFESQGIVFIDTEDACRDDIFKINRQRLAIDNSKFQDLPVYNPKTTVLEYVKSLSTDITYKIPINDATIYIPLAFIILASKPSIKINIEAHANSFFNFIGSHLTLADLEQYNEFYLTTPEGIMIVDFSNGPVKLQRIGLADMEKALTIGTLVPTVLGKEKLVTVDCWRNIFQDCLNKLNGYRSKRKQTLEEILT